MFENSSVPKIHDVIQHEQVKAQTYPLSILFYVTISTQIYCHLDAIDGIHARNTKTSSPLGELVDHICDTFGLIFIVLTFCNIYNINNIITQNLKTWYL